MKKEILLYFALLLWFVVPVQAQLTIFGSDLEAKNGETVTMDFKVVDFDSINVFQFSLNWDSTVLAYKSVTATDSLGGLRSSPALTNFNNSESGKLRVFWVSNDGEGKNLKDSLTLFSVSFDVIGKPDSSTVVAFSNNPTVIEVTSWINNSSKDLTLNYTNGSVKIKGMGTPTYTVETNPTILYQNEPNPFNDHTFVKFQIQKADYINLQIFDLKGQLILSQEEYFNAGNQQFMLQADQFPASGTYLYRIAGSDMAMTKKMTVIR